MKKLLVLAIAMVAVAGSINASSAKEVATACNNFKQNKNAGNALQLVGAYGSAKFSGVSDDAIKNSCPELDSVIKQAKKMAGL